MEPTYRLLQTIVKFHGGFPTEFFLSERNVGSAATRIVLGQWSEYQFARRAQGCDDLFSQFADGKLVGIADVDGADEVVLIHHPDDGFDEIIAIAERTRLRSVTKQCDVLARESLADEVGHYPAIVGMHPRAVGIENSHDSRIDVVAAVVIHEQRFGDTFAFVITRPDADGVDVAAIRFGLRVFFWIAVHFARARLQDPRTAAFSDAEHIDRAKHAGLDRLDRVVLVVPRSGWAGQIINFVDFEVDWQRDIVAEQLEIGATEQMGDVGFLTGEEIVQTNDIVSIVDESFAKMRAEKTSAAGDKNSVNHESLSRIEEAEYRGEQREFCRAVVNVHRGIDRCNHAGGPLDP